MRESVPAIAKAKIADASTMDKAWKLEDLDYGTLQEVCAKLKEQIQGLKLKTTTDLAKIVKQFHQVQAIVAKIIVKGSISLLENDKEYVVLVGKYLSKEVMWKW